MGKTDQIETSMKIFGIGLSRTGTTSLSKALNILGFESRHFIPELFVNQDKIFDNLSFEPQIKLNFYWSRIRKSEIEFLQAKGLEVFNSCQAFGDLPIPLFYKELDKVFPGSKFIYTFRDIDKWLVSMKWLLSDGQVLWKAGFVNEEIRYAMYGTCHYDEERLRTAYWNHHNDVMEYFKDRPEDLLTINIDERRIDFASLCSFLSLPVIDQPFPKTNQSTNVTIWNKIDYWLSRKNIIYSLARKIWKRVRLIY